MQGGINTVYDLPTQNKVRYGCVTGGTTELFFKESSEFKEIYNNMQNTKPSPMVTKGSEGISRVRQGAGNYAYFMESTSIEYITQRDCDLTQLGGLLDSKGYGLALKKNSKYRDQFNQHILQFAEQGVLTRLKKKWWEDEGGGKCPPSTVSSGGAAPLTMAHVGGVFVVLVGGCGAATVMGVIEFLWKSRKLGRNTEESRGAEMWKELSFALQCREDKKPVKKSKPPTANPSLEGSVPYLAFPK